MTKPPDDKEPNQLATREAMRLPSPPGLKLLLSELEENGKDAQPLSAAVIRTTLRNLLGFTRQGESAAGVLAHSLGTELVILATHGAHRTLGYASFELFAGKELHLGSSTVYDRLQIARGSTEEQCKEFGLERIRLGLQIAKALGKSTIGDLVPRDPARVPRLPVERPLALPPSGRGGPVEAVATTTFAQASADQLEVILALLRPPRPVEAPTPKTVREASARANEARDRLLQKHPALKDLGVKAFVRDGKRLLDPGKPATGEEIDAAVAWLQAVKKLDRRAAR